MVCINGYGHVGSGATRRLTARSGSMPPPPRARLARARIAINPPFNDTHPRSEVARSFSAKNVTEGAKSIVATMPTLLVWGVKDHALPPGNLTGCDRYFTDLRFRLFTEGDHNVSQLKYREVNAEIREFLQGRTPRGSRSSATSRRDALAGSERIARPGRRRTVRGATISAAECYMRFIANTDVTDEGAVPG